MRPISEEIVRAAANILGPSSAAADALRDAEARRARGETVVFFEHRNILIVHGTPADSQQQERQATVKVNNPPHSDS